MNVQTRCPILRGAEVAGPGSGVNAVVGVMKCKACAKLSCLSTDPRTAREFFHTVGDNRSQLHHLLAQFRVFRNVALNAIAIVCSFLRSV